MGLEGWVGLVDGFGRVGLGFGFGLEMIGRRHKTTSGANPKHGCPHGLGGLEIKGRRHKTASRANSKHGCSHGLGGLGWGLSWGWR